MYWPHHVRRLLVSASPTVRGLLLFNEWETLSHRKKTKTKPRLLNIPCVRLLHLFWALRKSLRGTVQKRKYQVFHYLLRVSNPPFFVEKKSICSSTHLYPCTCTSRIGDETQCCSGCCQCWDHRAGSMHHCLHLCKAHTLMCVDIAAVFTLNCGDDTFLKPKVFFPDFRHLMS